MLTKSSKDEVILEKMGLNPMPGTLKREEFKTQMHRVNFEGIMGWGQDELLGLRLLWAFPDTKHMSEEINDFNSYAYNEREFSIFCGKLETDLNTAGDYI